MKKRSRLLLSGDGAVDSPEVIWLHISDELPNIELPPVVLPRELLDKRVIPRQWDQNPESWYARFRGGRWVWTTRKFPQTDRSRTENLTVRRLFSLPAGVVNPSAHVIACAIGGLEMWLDDRRIGEPKRGPTGAENFYAELDLREKMDPSKTEHVLEFCITKTEPATGVLISSGGTENLLAILAMYSIRSFSCRDDSPTQIEEHSRAKQVVAIAIRAQWHNAL